MARGAIKVVSINGALTVTFTAASGATPAAFSDEACTNSLALPATVADGAATTFYFASPGTYNLSVKTSTGVQIAGDLNSTKVVTVFSGDVGVYAYDARLVAKDFSGDTGRHSPSTDLAGTFSGRRGGTANPVAPLPYFNVKDYGATGDGATDDTTACQAAIDAATAYASTTNSRVKVLFPYGCYLLNTATSAGGITFALSLVGDNVWLEGEAGTVLKTTGVSTRILFITGAGKPEGVANWLKYAPWRYAGDTFQGGAAITPACPDTLYAINSGAARGTMTVTTSTAANAGNFTAGDYVIVRAGQVAADGANWNAEPDSEYNVVVSADAGTGIITFERPLAKDYAAENQTAIGATSSVGGGGSAAPLGIRKINTSVIKNVGLRNLRFEYPNATASPITIRGTVFGLTEENIDGDGLAALHDAIEYAYARIKGVRAVMRGTNREDFWPVTLGTGCHDVILDDVTGIATNKSAVLHMHEGSARVRANKITLMSGQQASNTNPEVSIRSRAYDVELTDYFISGHNQTNAIIVGADCTGGGRIGRGIVRKPAMTARTILCQATNWYIEPPNDGLGGDIQYDPVVRSAAQSLPVRVISAWVDHTTTSATLGIMPADSIIISGGVHVYTAFNAGTTNPVNIGSSGSHSSIAGPIDVSTAFNKTVAVGAAMGFRDTAATVMAFYEGTGTAATVGRALVWLLIATAPAQVAP